MKNYFYLLCAEIVHPPSVLCVHKGGPGERIGLLWFSAAGESSAPAWVLVPSLITSRGTLTNREWVKHQIKSPEQHCVMITFPACQLWGGKSSSPAVERPARTSLTVKGHRLVGFRDAPLHFQGLFDLFLANHSCQAKASEQLRSHISSSAPSLAASSKCLF